MVDDAKEIVGKLTEVRDRCPHCNGTGTIWEGADPHWNPLPCSCRRQDAQIVAESLTQAAREALDWVRPHSIVAPYRRGANEIEAAGLVKRNGAWFTITPLGLQVRALLHKEQCDG